MSWYRSGTVSCTQNSMTVTGTGTAFAANSRVGDALLGPDGDWYELVNVASDTVISILPAYRGPSISVGEFAIAPVQGYVKASADRLRDLTAGIGGIAASPAVNAVAQLVPLADTLPYFVSEEEADLLSFTSAARSLIGAQTALEQRVVLGLKAAAVLDADAFVETFLKASTQAAQREALGIKTAALLDANAFVQAFLNAASAAAQRAVLGLGSAALLDESEVGGAQKTLIVHDRKATGTDGGTFTSGAWRTRDLNTAVVNDIQGASIANNQITLPAGTYDVDITCPAWRVDRHRSMLANVTAGTTLLYSQAGFSWSANNYAESTSRVTGRFTISAVTVLEVRHYCTSTMSASGFGMAMNLGVDPEIYTQATIRKVA